MNGFVGVVGVFVGGLKEFGGGVFVVILLFIVEDIVCLVVEEFFARVEYVDDEASFVVENCFCLMLI